MKFRLWPNLILFFFCAPHFVFGAGPTAPTNQPSLNCNEEYEAIALAHALKSQAADHLPDNPAWNKAFTILLHKTSSPYFTYSQLRKGDKEILLSLGIDKNHFPSDPKLFSAFLIDRARKAGMPSVEETIENYHQG